MLHVDVSFTCCRYFVQKSPICILTSIVSVSLDVCDFRSCYSDDFAGAIHISSEKGFISISNIFVNDCKSTNSSACAVLRFNSSGRISANMVSFANSGSNCSMWGSTFVAHDVVSNINCSHVMARWEPAFYITGMLENATVFLSYACIHSCFGLNSNTARMSGESVRIEFLNFNNNSKRLGIDDEFLLVNSNFYDNCCEDYILSLSMFGIIKDCYFDNISMINGLNYSLETTLERLPIKIFMPIRAKSQRYKMRKAIHKSITFSLLFFKNE